MIHHSNPKEMLMLKHYKYNKAELDKLLKSIVILCDTREQKNEHIINYFEKNNIKHEEMALKYGDYAFYLPKCEEFGILRDIYYNGEIVIERKGSLEEISGNLTNDRQRLEDEFLRSKSKIILMIEGSGYDQILKHGYKTDLNEKAFIASLFSFKYRYDIDIQFIGKENAGKFIYNSFYYYLREGLMR